MTLGQNPALPDSHTEYVFTMTGEDVSWSMAGLGLGLLVLTGAAAYFLRLRKAEKKR